MYTNLLDRWMGHSCTTKVANENVENGQVLNVQPNKMHPEIKIHEPIESVISV